MHEQVTTWVSHYRQRLLGAVWRAGFFRLSAWCLLVAACLVLAARLLQLAPSPALVTLACLFLPAAAAWWAARRALPDDQRLAADLDARYRCGGLLVSAENEGAPAWAFALPEVRLPRVEVDLGRAVVMTVAGWLLLVTMFALPEVWFASKAGKPIMIQSRIAQKEQQIQVLEQEKLIDQHEAAKLRETLRKVTEEAQRGNPAQTWQALDAMQRSMETKARAAWNKQQQQLQEAQAAAALGRQLNGAASLSDESWQAAMDDYQAWAAAQRGDNALLDEALTQAGDFQGQTREQVEAQLVEIQKVLKLSAEELAALRERLERGELSGEGTLVMGDGTFDGDAALAAFLAEGSGKARAAVGLMAAGGQGAISRGPGSGPIEWSNKTPDGQDPFEALVLPRAAENRPNSGVRLAVTRQAPEVAGAAVVGGFDGSGVAVGGTGSANRQQILPRHRAAVGRYFERKPASK